MSSQWERIFKGDSVDLNQIFASLHHTVPDEERKGRLGDTEVSFGFPEAKKRVRTASEWSTAWRRAAKAISFAFPHRREELLDYGDYIEEEFAAKLASSHHRIILYDVALRNEQSSCQTALKATPLQPSLKKLSTTRNPPESLKSATSSTAGPASSPRTTADINISANPAKNQATPAKTVREGANEIYGIQPKYLRHNLWEASSVLSPTTAEWSLYAPPLPRPPRSEIMNPIVQKTIADNPNLFKIVTPIKVDVFESLLVNHPNQPFIQSVCMGLREGFWPWADTLRDNFPDTHDESRPPPTDPRRSDFLHEQCKIEIDKGRFSPSFGMELLPGMYSMPIYAVDKPNSTDLRLVTDHSAGPFSLNNMIDHTKVTGFPLDNLRQLGEILLDVKRSIGNVPITMWKSDISEAYRLMPVHPCWQIKQINTIGGRRFVDHNLAFGSSGSPGIFISFNSLVAWIAKYVKLFDYLANYVDDSSGCDPTGETLLYEPYNQYLPSHQKQLLDLWDELGIPHKPKKQVSGSPLTIIGIEVDPNSMTFSLPPSAKSRLLYELSFWASKPPKHSSGSFKLKHWERMAGWFNWALNVYPHLRPALNNVYSKIMSKHNREQRIYINNAIRDDFMWAIHHIEKSEGVHLLKSTSWSPADADYVVYCDACPEGMGFWYPDNKTGFYAPTPVNVPCEYIFYFESLCVLSALDNVQSRAVAHQY
ncbi:hypothetical protein BYT27DRAFT_7252098 [Phlegmacium glaucopus]|nr:hypothetical protein BYT27DRAFT_7252098 [Phlegmacium glaucopus]